MICPRLIKKFIAFSLFILVCVILFVLGGFSPIAGSQEIVQLNQGILTLNNSQFIVVDKIEKRGLLRKNWGVIRAVDRVNINFRLRINASFENLRMLNNSEDERRIWVDRAPGKPATVFKNVGLTWRDCEENSEECGIAWPTSGSPLVVVSSALVEVRDPFTNDWVWKLFHQVKVNYWRLEVVADSCRTDDKSNDGCVHLINVTPTGWISAEDVRLTKRSDALPEGRSMDETLQLEYKIGTQPESVYEPLKKPKLSNLLTKELSLEAVIQRISPSMGHCVLGDGRSGFLKTLFAHWVNVNDSAIEGIRYQNKSLKKQDLLAIDTFARTLYGEMAQCYKYGKQYPMAAAAVINNRVNDLEKQPEFCRYEIKAPQSKHTCVMTSESQFSVWNAIIRGRVNPSLKHVLCPPHSARSDFWKGHRPGDMELELWQESLKIATLAYLEPEDFREKTHHVSGYFYTSNKGRFYNYEFYSASINNSPLDRRSCIELWK